MGIFPIWDQRGVDSDVSLFAEINKPIDLPKKKRDGAWCYVVFMCSYGPLIAETDGPDVYSTPNLALLMEISIISNIE